MDGKPWMDPTPKRSDFRITDPTPKRNLVKEPPDPTPKKI